MPRRIIRVDTGPATYQFNDQADPLVNGLGYAIGTWLRTGQDRAEIEMQRAAQARAEQRESEATAWLRGRQVQQDAIAADERTYRRGRDAIADQRQARLDADAQDREAWTREQQLVAGERADRQFESLDADRKADNARQTVEGFGRGAAKIGDWLFGRGGRTARPIGPQPGEVAPAHLVDELGSEVVELPRYNSFGDPIMAPGPDGKPGTADDVPVMEMRKRPRRDAADRLRVAGIDPATLRFQAMPASPPPVAPLVPAPAAGAAPAAAMDAAGEPAAAPPTEQAVPGAPPAAGGIGGWLLPSLNPWAAGSAIGGWLSGGPESAEPAQPAQPPAPTPSRLSADQLQGVRQGIDARAMYAAPYQIEAGPQPSADDQYYAETAAYDTARRSVQGWEAAAARDVGTAHQAINPEVVDVLRPEWPPEIRVRFKRAVAAALVQPGPRRVEAIRMALQALAEGG